MGIFNDSMTAAAVIPPTPEFGPWAGDKYPGGFGPTQLFEADYWTLRARSGQLFTENLYARGIVRRFVTNVINTGLTLESMPDETVLGLPEDSLTDWSEDLETRHTLWGKDPRVCDVSRRRTWGQLQREAFLEALVSGDVLVTLTINPITGLPAVNLISGDRVQTPFVSPDLAPGHVIREGVELNSDGVQVAYHVQVDRDFGTEYQRVPAFGENSGRRVAWLVYGTELRVGEVRGQPLLAIVMQGIKEIDRYRDAAQRKAAINAILAAFVEKTQDKMGTKPFTGGAVRRDTATVEDPQNTAREFSFTKHNPGTVIDELQYGEVIKPYPTAGTDVNFGPFEDAIVSGMAWALEVPPEILKLAFTDNYSASQAAINEFKMFLNMRRTTFGDDFCQPIHIEVFTSLVLLGRVKAEGFLEARRDLAQYDVYGAWLASDWSGAIKPSTDIVKQAKGYDIMTRNSWVTNGRATRELTGTKFSKNVRRLRKENQMKADALRPMLELNAEFGEAAVQSAMGRDAADAIADSVIDRLALVEEA